MRNAVAADSRLNAMLGKAFTDDQLKEAKEQFTKALDLFVELGAELTIHPLTEMLQAEGLPELTSSIVKELYTSQVKRLTKNIIDPLAHSLFRPHSPEASVALETLSRASQRPVFDEKAIPPKIASPTVADRLEERERRLVIEKAVRETVRRR